MAAAVHPLPTSPPPARRVVVPRVRNRLVVAAAAAVICLSLTSMWLLFGSLLTVEIGRLACGQDCPVVAAASKVFVVAVVTLVLLHPFSVLPPDADGPRPRGAGLREATDIEAAEAPPPKTFAAAARKALRDPVLQACLASMLFVLLVGVGALLMHSSPVKGSRQERMGSMIFEVGALGVYMVDFFVVCPIFTVRMWRALRMVLHS